MTKTAAYGATCAKSKIAPLTIERRNAGANDVEIEILYCGVCHTDIHFARNDWGRSIYPVVPGHEIVGRVIKVGKNVKKFKTGQFAAVGCMVDSCNKCKSCHDHLEQYCENGFSGTYNGADKKSGGHTFGGYSTNITVDQRFVLKISDKLKTKLKAVAPLLCAGITTYSPLRHWGVKKGQRVGIVGLGGLGHMGIKFAKAFGAHVTMITTSPNKAKDAKKLGAKDVLISTDTKAMEKEAGKFDYILNTIPYPHDANPYVNLLKRDGVMTIVGCLEPLPNIMGGPLILSRRTIAGSLIGGIKETQEMLDFCAKHNIVADIEMIKMDEINEAYERMQKSDVKYRFVIDMKSLKAA